MIPFFRTPDRTQIGHESTYFPPVRTRAPSQASLRLGYVLSQDGYGSATDLQIKGAQIAMPNLAVGRLVETPSQIAGMVDAYLHPSGGSLHGCADRAGLLARHRLRLRAGRRGRRREDAKDGMTGTPRRRSNDELISNAGSTLPTRRRTARRSETARNRGLRPISRTACSGLAARPRLPRRALQRQRRARGRLHIRPHDDAAEGVEHELPNAIVFSVGCHSGYPYAQARGTPTRGACVSAVRASLKASRPTSIARRLFAITSLTAWDASS